MSPLLKTPPPPDDMIISYMTLRKLIGVLGMILAPLLIVGTFLADHSTFILPSVSAYYHSGMGDILVGIISGIAFFLVCYHGPDWIDSLMSKVAAAAAFGIAFFPTSNLPEKTDPISKVHYISAGIFFAVLAGMSLFLFTRTHPNKKMTPEKKLRNKIYRICGVIIIIAVVGIPICEIKTIKAHIAFLKPTLVLEIVALEAFGFSWLVKGEALLKDD